jgi:hypothetical protein
MTLTFVILVFREGIKPSPTYGRNDDQGRELIVFLFFFAISVNSNAASERPILDLSFRLILLPSTFNLLPSVFSLQSSVFNLLPKILCQHHTGKFKKNSNRHPKPGLSPALPGSSARISWKPFLNSIRRLSAWIIFPPDISAIWTRFGKRSSRNSGAIFHLLKAISVIRTCATVNLFYSI